ncbi:MAG: sigma-70 family RNA polymerase sigma factor [Syntrophales bacterium]
MDKKQRDQLVLQYAPLVKSVVSRVTAKLPLNAMDKEEMVNVGIIGLMSAIDKFDKQRNVKFETYACFRIRGAVLDELRARDWVPRSTRDKDSKLERTFSALKKTLGRPPREEEAAKYLGISLEEYYKLLDKAQGISLISSEDLPPDYLDNCRQTSVLELMEHGNPLNLLSSEELRSQLKQGIDELPPKERLVLSLYYYDELTMKEIGGVMELTESRVCQLHSQAIIRLRALIKQENG